MELLKNAPNPVGVLSSKGIIIYVQYYYCVTVYIACGEPPMCMSCSALFAVKKAIDAAREEVGNKEFFPLCESMIIKTHE